MASASAAASTTTGQQPFLAVEQPRRRVDDLPDLTQRIHDLGLTDEYNAFKDRYLAWRQGDSAGARGEVTADHITRPEHVAANRGFGFWYPSVQEWLWRRTISYWIAVTFFEGAIFFTMSSFLYNYKEQLGDYYGAVTLYGYCAGKVLFFTCCYFMCIEVINLNTGDSTDVSREEGHDDVSNRGFTPDSSPFYFWPFRWKLAFEKLNKAELGPWPYLAAVLYFSGVLAFTVGLVAELAPGLPKDVEGAILNWSFLAGSLLFFAGAVAECIQNGTFTTLDVSMGWCSALLNLLGGVGFTVGAVLAWFDGEVSCNMYGVGSALYVVSSSIQIVMWKDEQFGLTFLAVLNKMGENGRLARPVSGTLEHRQQQEDQHSFSGRGALFIHVYCWCGAMSMYNFNIELMRYFQQDSWRSFQYAINEFLPCLFAHIMLAMNSAVLHAPKVAPFRQLFFCSRALGVILAVNSTITLYQFLDGKITQ